MNVQMLFILGAVAETALLVAVAAWGDGIVRAFPLSLATIIGAGCVYLVACALAERYPELDTRRNLWIIIVGAAVMMGAQIPVVPTLSDDLFRYLWDGHVQSNGINPFIYPPDALELIPLRTQWHTYINHPDISTIYPPLSQMLFLCAALISQHPAAIKLLLAASVAVSAWMVVDMLRRRGEPTIRVVWLLWNPLVIIETARAGHIDVFAALFVVTVLWLIDRGREVGAWIALAAGMMAKLYPVLLLPVLWSHRGERDLRGHRDLRGRRGWRGLRGPFAFVMVCTLLTLPYIGAAERLFVGLGAYSGGWRHNETVFAMLAWLIPDERFMVWLTPILLDTFGRFGLTSIPSDHVEPLTRIVTAVALVVTILFISTRLRWSAEYRVWWILLALLGLAPAVFPWYVVMVCPLLPLMASRSRTAGSRAVWPVAVFTVLLPLSYWTLPMFHAGGPWVNVPIWIRFVEYGIPLTITLGISLQAILRRNGQTGTLGL
jgi:hypothetical protein